WLHLPVGAVIRIGADHLLHPRPVRRHTIHALAGTGHGAEARARMRFEWDWEFTFDILPRLLMATVNTLLAAGIGYAIAVVLGLVFALAQRTPSRTFPFAVRELVEFIRSTPLVLQIFFVFYVGPQFGIRLSPWVAGMIA